MNLDEMDKLIALIGASRVQSFEFRGKGEHLRVALEARPSKAPNVIPLIEVAKATPVVKSPGMGVVRLTHPQQGEPFARAGEVVKKGQIVAFLQYHDVLDAIVSEQDGVLSQARVNEGDIVGYADTIFELK